MQKSHGSSGLATHIGPESCGAAREGGVEALAGERTGPLPAPTGSGPGFRRPVIVVQCDAMNGSRLGTTACVPLTSNLKWGAAPGNVSLSARLTGLPKIL
jgi:PemK-like, MazF-like toxin of type II toxin-antitoxin system